MSELFLPQAPPESVGISSAVLMEFIQTLEARENPMHSVLVIKDGVLVCEGYWAPFKKERKHRMYSVTKSFVSLAIGILIDQKKLSLADPVSDYFSKYQKNLPAYLKEVTVRDLLMMASVHDGTTYKRKDGSIDTSHWIDTYFSTPPSHPGGQVFLYDTSATTVLSALVEEVSGKPLLDFLRGPLLDPIGFSKDAWCVKTPCGYSWGGSGLVCTSRDLARVALVCLQGGAYQGRQLISEEYIKEATQAQIDNRITAGRDQQGYGYQIWRIPHNGFGFIGMGCQIALCYPEKNLLVVTTGDTQEYPELTNHTVDLFSETVYPTVENHPILPNPTAYKKLQNYVESLSLQPLAGAVDSPVAKKVSGITYQMKENPLEFSTVRFVFEKGKGTLYYQTPRGDHELSFGFGTLMEGKFPETHYYREQIGIPGGAPYHCVASAAWTQDSQLTLYCYSIDDYLGLLKITFAFEKDTLTLYGEKHAEWFFDEYQGFAVGSSRELKK